MKLIQLTIIFNFLSTANCLQSKEIEKERILNCYQKHPILLKLLISIKDDEIKNYKDQLTHHFVNESTKLSMRKCAKNILKFAKNENALNEKYVFDRLEKYLQ